MKFIARTGKVVLGFRRTIKMVKLGKIKYVVMASNAPEDIRNDVEYYSRLSGVKIIRFPGTNKELGALIGKPFSVTVLGIVDLGQVPQEALDRLGEGGEQ